MKRTIPLLIASVTGLVLIVSSFIPATESWGDVAMTWFNILAAIAMLLGTLNLLRMSLQKISDRRPGWGYAGITVVAMLATIAVGLLKVGVPPNEKHPGAAWSGEYNVEGSGTWWMFQYVMSPITATMFAMLAFFVASAAFRAFRAKNAEASILLATAVIVLLGKTYAATWITGWIPENSDFAFLRLERITAVVMDVFNKAGSRAIMIGVALGVVSTSLKIILGIDRSYLGGEKE